MSKVGRWSTAAGSNNAAVPDGWPEGQLPSTVNNCAREMMASIRTLVEDLQYIDQDFTPTFITASSFSVPGNQTSAIHIGRRLKCFDATAGVQQIIYGTIVSVSFTAVTTIHIEADAGSLTSSLSSFGISVIANTPNNALPRNLVLTVSSITVLGGMSLSGSLALNSLSISATAAAGVGIFGSISVSATAVANVVLANSLSVVGAVIAGSLSVVGAVVAANGTFSGGLTVSATATIGVLRALNNSITCVAAGGFICTGDVTAFSDPRLKSDWEELPYNFIDNLALIQSGVYRRIDSGYKQVGVNAAELQAFLPEAVHGTPPDYLSVAYGNAALVACVELAKRVIALERRVQELSK